MKQHFRKRELGSIVKLSDLRRPNPSKSPRAIILIVCEGRKTEPTYFNALCQKLGLTTVEVEIVGDASGSAPISVVEDAISRKEKRSSAAPILVGRSPYDSIWCVMDTEAPGTNSSLPRALDKAKQYGLKVALSNPCFEFWILLHFIDTCRSFQNCAEVLSEIRRHIPDYGKGKNYFHLLGPKTPEAIKCSRKQLKIKSYDKCPNPCTFIHEIVEELMGIVEKPS